ncbi:Protein CBG24759 [Caenorhabditis briggsae]|uniref:Protein CBG24759 n=1 Tax=Caenorhabditis briggsae TaxID=6238 RepID=A8WLF0_CAEBR|nr:Protein CBG24759 [Caenorhabditis briggsae]CAP21295.2 Protein CBG24759 [Caenorhabditis briggsae]
MSSGFNQPTSSGFNQPTSSGFNQPTSSGFNQPTSSGFNQPTSSGFNQPTSSGFNQPTSSGFNQPMSSGFNQPTSSGFNQPSSAAVPAPMTPAATKIRPMKIKKELSDDFYNDTVFDGTEVKVQRIVRQPKGRVSSNLQMQELPKTENEAFQRWEQEQGELTSKVQNFCLTRAKSEWMTRNGIRRWSRRPRPQDVLFEPIHEEAGGWDDVKASHDRKVRLDKW